MVNKCAACNCENLIQAARGFFMCSECGLGQLPYEELMKRSDASLAWIEQDGGHAPDIPEEAAHKAEVAKRILMGYHSFHGRGDTPDGPSGVCFEIGAGNGAIAVAIKDRGWDVTALDASKKASEEINKKGLKTCLGRFDGRVDDYILNKMWAGCFDLIVAWDSMEHMTDLYTAFRRVALCLKKGGIFVMHSPLFNTYAKDENHPHYGDPSHLWHMEVSTPSKMMGPAVKTLKIEWAMLMGNGGYAHPNNFVYWGVKQ